MVSSHILSELGEFCNKLGIIERGKLVVCGSITDLMARARTHPVLHVRVIGEVAPAKAALERDGRVRNVTIASDGELLVTLSDVDLHHHFLLEVLINAGVKIDSLTPQQLKLEDVFLRLTKGMVQ